MSVPSDRKTLATYRHIEANLRDKVQQGQWPVGTMLPSRRTLAREYGVSLVTIERAVARLVSDGLLRADDRRGTFVLQSGQLGSASSALITSPLDYAVSALPPAIRFRPGRAATVGIIASLYLMEHDHLSLNNFWVRMVVQSLEHAFSEDGEATHFYNRVREPGQPPVPLAEAVQTVLDDGVDAFVLIALGADREEIDASLAVLDNREVPVVCVTTVDLHRPVPHVFIDNRSAGYDAARHLLRRGHRNILFFAPFTASWVEERLEGVRAAVQHEGLPIEAVRVYPAQSEHWKIEEDPSVLGWEVAHALSVEEIAGTGVVSVNDGVALGFQRAAAEQGQVAGTDYGLVSFDDHPQARDCGLTSLRPPMEVMGKEAARLLLRALHGEETSTQVRCRSFLLPRASTHMPRLSHPLSNAEDGGELNRSDSPWRAIRRKTS